MRKDKTPRLFNEVIWHGAFAMRRADAFEIMAQDGFSPKHASAWAFGYAQPADGETPLTVQEVRAIEAKRAA